MDHIKEIIEESKETAQLQAKSCGARICKIDKQISELQERKRKLNAAKNQYSNIAKLNEEGAAAWGELSNKNKWKKENILAVFCSSKDIPEQFQEEFWRENAPEELVDDRDILLARASRGKEFAEYYNAASHQSLAFPCFPFQNLCWETRRWLPLSQNIIPEFFYRRICTEMSLTMTTCFMHWWLQTKVLCATTFILSLNRAMSRFSPRICSNEKYMLKAAKIGLNVFPCITGDLVQDKDFALKLADQSKELCKEGLECFSDSLKADREVVLAYVQRNGVCLKDASLEFRRDDLDIICAASDSSTCFFAVLRGRARQEKAGLWQSFYDERHFTMSCLGLTHQAPVWEGWALGPVWDAWSNLEDWPWNYCKST